MKCSPGISNFLEEISSLSCSIVFLYFFALITEEGFLISPRYSFELCIQMDISLLFSLLLLFYSQPFVRPPQTAILLFCISFSWGWSWSLSPVQCHEPHSIVHQALYLSDLFRQHIIGFCFSIQYLFSMTSFFVCLWGVFWISTSYASILYSLNENRYHWLRTTCK